MLMPSTKANFIIEILLKTAATLTALIQLNDQITL